MEELLDKIINGLLVTDTTQIRRSTADLMKAYESPQTLPALCQIVVSQRPAQIRQFAAVLLNKRLGKLRHWMIVPADQKEAIKRCMLQALIAEKIKNVRSAIAQLIGSLVRHEADKDSWLLELLKYIYDRCNAVDPVESETGAAVFATLTDAAPDQFIEHMGSICEMFSTVLAAAESRGSLATPTTANIIVGMTYLMPFVGGNSQAEQTVLKTMPLIIKTAHAFAHKNNVEEFAVIFDVMDSMAEYVPKLLSNNVKSLVELSLQTASNKSLDDAIRVHVVIFLGRLVRLRKKFIVKQKLMAPILAVIFELMCAETENDEADEFFSGESVSSPMTAATQTLDLLALNMPPDKLIPPLLQLLEPALQCPDPFRRRAAILCMAVIAEGCSDAICTKYLEIMLNIIKSGIADSASIVRVSSFFALGQFSEHLQPEISNFASQILPVLFDFLHQLVLELQMGGAEPQHMDRMFYALETYCENLEDNIVPHLPILMDRLFDTLDPHNSTHVRELALSTISSAALAAKENIMPYFHKIVGILQNYLVKDCDESLDALRVQAIDTLASISRVVGKENFMPLANDTMSYCLLMLDDGPDDPDFRRAVFNLIGALSNVVNDGMSTVFPKIMDRIVESVISSDDILPTSSESANRDLTVDANEEIDLDDEDDDDDDVDGYQVENDFMMEKEEAILALKEFAANTGNAFAPYLQTAFETVYKVVDHPQDVIRKVAIEALCEFVVALNKMGDIDGVKNACLIIMPKFAHIMRSDEEQAVVIHLLEPLGELFLEVKQPSVPTQTIAELMFSCIRDLLQAKMACQFNEPSGGGDEDDPEDSEYEELLIENAGNLLPQFGHALEAEVFSLYFGRLYQFFLKKLHKAKQNDAPDCRAFVYGAIADSFKPLGACCVTYFDALCPVFIGGMTDVDAKARQNAFYGAGQLVLMSEEKSFEAFPHILQALSDAISKETNPSALDNICGAVSRLIVTNLNLVPLRQVLPVLMSHLPLREDTEENDMVHKAFRVLYLHARPAIVEFIEQMLAVTIHVLYKKEMPNRECTENAVIFVKEIRDQYPEKFSTVTNSNPEVYNFVQSL